MVVTLGLARYEPVLGPGSHIVISWDRIDGALVKRNAAPVLAHEIAHYCRGRASICRRDSCKARSNRTNMRNLCWKPLAFAVEHGASRVLDS
jgi:hypothetical protein